MTFTTKIKKLFNISDSDINKVLVSKKETYGKYNCMIKDIQLLKSYSKIWKKLKNE